MVGRIGRADVLPPGKTAAVILHGLSVTIDEIRGGFQRSVGNIYKQPIRYCKQGTYMIRDSHILIETSLPTVRFPDYLLSLLPNFHKPYELRYANTP